VWKIYNEKIEIVPIVLHFIYIPSPSLAQLKTVAGHLPSVCIIIGDFSEHDTL